MRQRPRARVLTVDPLRQPLIRNQLAKPRTELALENRTVIIRLFCFRGIVRKGRGSFGQLLVGYLKKKRFCRHQHQTVLSMLCTLFCAAQGISRLQI